VILFRPALTYAAPPGRYERRRQSRRFLYTAAEVAALVLVGGCVAEFGVTLDGLAAIVFCLALVLITITDLEYHVVPNRVVLPAAGIVLVLRTAAHPTAPWAIAGLAAAGVLFVFALVNPNGLGMGDVKLALLIGFMLGRHAVLGLALGMVAAIVPAVVILVRHGRAGRSIGIPYAPFLALGSLVALFV
jgi:prepilin signal peptidase PulO-like enzyme (type II secretory pathway)